MSEKDNKDFIGKVAEVAGDAVEAVVKTTNEIVAKGKQQLELARCKSDIRECYKELGAVAYALEKGLTTEPEKKNEVVARLDELHAKLEAYEAERKAELEAKEAERAAKAAEKEKKVEPVEIRFESERCPACGEARVGTLPYCAYCGSKFAEVEPEVPEPVVPDVVEAPAETPVE